MSDNCTNAWKSFRDSLPLNGDKIKVKYLNASKDSDEFFNQVFQFEENLIRINAFQISCIMFLKWDGGSIQLCSCNINQMKWTECNENT